jgi:hypothetical protein
VRLDPDSNVSCAAPESVAEEISHGLLDFRILAKPFAFNLPMVAMPGNCCGLGHRTLQSSASGNAPCGTFRNERTLSTRVTVFVRSLRIRTT